MDSFLRSWLGWPVEMKHWSIDDNAFMNRSRITISSATMLGNRSNDLPHWSSSVLYRTASMRRTRSPLDLQG
jgi:hypothetical protein